MNSLTKVKLTEDQIKTILHNALHQEVLSFAEVNNGFYNTIYQITLPNERVYLKIAPDDEIDILTYEIGILKKEVSLNSLFEELQIPGPKVLYADFTRSIIPNDYYIMSEIKGQTLFERKDEIQDKKPYYIQLMKYLATLHNIHPAHFGYPNLPTRFSTYGDTLLHMFDNIKQDGAKKNVEMPPFILELLQKIRTHKDLLDTLKKPSILHFDGWDGNIMIDGSIITGLLDTERSFHGYPVADFVCLSFDIFAEEYRDLIDVYNEYAKTPISLDTTTKLIYNIHKAYLFFIMYVECYYRDINGSFDWQKQWAINVLQELNRLIPDKASNNS